MRACSAARSQFQILQCMARSLSVTAVGDVSRCLIVARRRSLRTSPAFWTPSALVCHAITRLESLRTGACYRCAPDVSAGTQPPGCANPNGWMDRSIDTAGRIQTWDPRITRWAARRTLRAKQVRSLITPRRGPHAGQAGEAPVRRSERRRSHPVPGRELQREEDEHRHRDDEQWADQSSLGGPRFRSGRRVRGQTVPRGSRRTPTPCGHSRRVGRGSERSNPRFDCRLPRI